MPNYLLQTLSVVVVLGSSAAFAVGICRLAFWLVSDSFSLDKMSKVLAAGGIGWFVLFMTLLESGLSVPYKSGGFYEVFPFYMYMFFTMLLSMTVAARVFKHFEDEKREWFESRPVQECGYPPLPFEATP